MCRLPAASSRRAGSDRPDDSWQLGLPTGIIAAIGNSTSLQNARMMQMLMAKHGGILVRQFGFRALETGVGLLLPRQLNPQRAWRHGK